MLFVVAIVVTVAAIAVPSILNSTRPMRLRNDAHALANLVTMARMRAATEFAHVEISCFTTATPAYCQLQSYGFNGTQWISEAQKVYLSAGVSFGIPATINTKVTNQSVAYQGDAAENTPTVTTNPIILFNSRGLPIDPTGATTNPTYDYALYLKDTTNNYYAVSVNQTGHPSLYQWNATTLAFTPLLEYGNGS
jgi:Tfp pilus assembly protein FimT